MAKITTEKQEMRDTVQKYHCRISFLTRLLGTAPSDPALYKDFIIGKAIDQLLRKARTDEDKAAIEDLRAARTDHELTLLPSAVNSNLLIGSPDSVKAALVKNQTTGGEETEQKGKTIFRADKNGLLLPGYMVKGFFKEAASAVASFAQPKSRIDKWLYVAQGDIPLMRDGAQLQRSDTYDFTRSLRTEDQYGVSRTCLAVSEVLDPPCWIEFDILVLPKGFIMKSDSGKFTPESVKQWLEYGCFTGLGQWRNGSNGAFRVDSFSEVAVTWQEAVDLRIISLSQPDTEEPETLEAAAAASA